MSCTLKLCILLCGLYNLAANPPANEDTSSPPTSGQENAVDNATQEQLFLDRVAKTRAVVLPDVKLTPDGSEAELVVTVTDVLPGRHHLLHVCVKSHYAGRITLEKAHVSCGCVTPGAIPKIWDPGEELRIPVLLDIPPTTDKTQQTVTLLTTGQQQIVLAFQVSPKRFLRPATDTVNVDLQPGVPTTFKIPLLVHKDFVDALRGKPLQAQAGGLTIKSVAIVEENTQFFVAGVLREITTPNVPAVTDTLTFVSEDFRITAPLTFKLPLKNTSTPAVLKASQLEDNALRFVIRAAGELQDITAVAVLSNKETQPIVFTNLSLKKQYGFVTLDTTAIAKLDLKSIVFKLQLSDGTAEITVPIKE